MPILPSGLEITLNNTEHPHAMGESHHGHIPYWKRAHHDWRFWIGLVLMLTAMAVYVGSDDLVWVPWGRPKVPAAVHGTP
jgi:uncharacterized membrane protein